MFKRVFVDRDEFVYKAYHNTLNVLLGFTTTEELIESDRGYFAHNPQVPMDLETLENLRDYFAHVEEYENAELVKLMIEDGGYIGKDYRLF